MDRAAANTYRMLARADRAPVAWAGVDCVLFQVEGPEDIPAGLELSDQLGKAKVKGSIAVESARELLASNEPKAILRLIERIEEGTWRR